MQAKIFQYFSIERSIHSSLIVCHWHSNLTFGTDPFVNSFLQYAIVSRHSIPIKNKNLSFELGLVSWKFFLPLQLYLLSFFNNFIIFADIFVQYLCRKASMMHNSRMQNSRRTNIPIIYFVSLLAREKRQLCM